MEDSAGLFEIRQVDQQGVEISGSQGPFNNEPNYGNELVQLFEFFFINFRAILLNKLVVKMIEPKVLEGIPPF